MRYAAPALVAALSLSGAVASPTRRHAHHQHHAKRQTYDADWDALDWKDMDVDWTSAYYAGIAAEKTSSSSTPAPTPAAASTTPAAPVVAAEVTSSATPVAPATTTTSSFDLGGAIESSVAQLWNGLIGAANDITSFGEEVAASGSAGDFYYGNYGSPWGHNMMKVDSTDGYAFTAEFINTSGKPMTLVIWNKVGPDLQPLSGSALAPSKPALTLALDVQESQIVAFQDNSQIAWAQACDAKAASGAFATSWGEANLASGGSGFDLSAIMNPAGNNYNMKLSSTQNSCVSDMTQNYWLTATQPIGTSDGSCYVPGSSLTLTVNMGGYTS